MPSDLVNLTEAAQRLGLSRRRVQALIANGQLSAQRIGRQHVVSLDALRALENTRLPREGGRQLSAAAAWRRIAGVADGEVPLLSRERLDIFRRSVRPRADHRPYYVHPALLGEVQASSVVLGGRLAAAVHGAAVDGDQTVDAYLRASDVEELTQQVRARPVDQSDPINVWLHVVPDQDWPFGELSRFAPAWVAWLDLADRQDRSADTLLDQLLGGRVLG